jgi:hypothetical protein
MGRKKDPALLDAKGAFIKNPSRRRKREPKPQSTGELGSAPSRLSKEERAVWKELAEQFSGVLGFADRQNFEKMVRLEAASRDDFFGMRVGDRNLLVKLTSQFEERARTVAPKPESKLDAFLQRKSEHENKMAAMSDAEKNAITRAESQKIDAHLASVAAGGMTGAERLEAAMAEAAAKRAAKVI